MYIARIIIIGKNANKLARQSKSFNLLCGFVDLSFNHLASNHHHDCYVYDSQSQ